MLTAAAHRFAFALVLFALSLSAGTSAFAQLTTGADTIISNSAEATYLDEDGNAFGTVSPTITITVRPISAVVTTPDETAPSDAVSPNERATRTFRVCNGGNSADLYTITRAEVSAPATIFSLNFDNDDTGTLTTGDAPITIGTTLSPRLLPHACTNVIAVIDVNASVPGSRLTISITARSNVATSVNGLVSDDGTIINSIGDPAHFTDPTNAAAPPLKLVNNLARAVAAPGETLDYTVSFRNRGAVTARNVLAADDLPVGLDYVAGSLRLGQRTLTDTADTDEGQLANNNRRIEIRLAQVAADEVVTFSFRARVNADIHAGEGAVNIATITGDNVERTNSAAAVAVINPFGIVFSGRSGGSTTIAGARVSLLTAQTTDSTLQTIPNTGFTPNAANDNPFTTPAGGTFGFVLSSAQLGAAGAPTTYYLNVSAHGYRTRMIEFAVRPDSNGLYTANVRALDDQPLALAGSFALTDAPVTLVSLASVALNIPLFETQTIEIAKSADLQRAEIGDVVTYRVEVRNTTQAALNDLTVRDTLPQSFHYADGTALLQIAPAPAQAFAPEVTGSDLIFRLPTLAANANATITYRVRIGANAREGDQVNNATVTARFAGGDTISAGPAHATVRVGAGVFSTRQMIVGRVFVDANGNGQFDKGERAVAGARLYIDNGQSVITDSQGMYNLPSVEDGAVVISLDPVTIPHGLMLTDEGHRSGRSWTRLLRTPLGGGTLLRQNFALSRAEAGDETGTQTSFDANEKRAASDTNVGAGLVPARNGAGGAPPSQSSVPTNDATNNTTDNATRSALAREGPGRARPLQDASTIATVNESSIAKIADVKPMAAGTYEVESKEIIEAVAPGDVVVASPANNEVVLQPSMSVIVRVAEGWTASLELNGASVGDQNIGERRVDHKNKITTIKFVGLNLKPGENRLRAFAISPEGAAGKAAALTVRGRGAARRIEITSERGELQAGGRDSMLVRVRAFDEWGNPAADGLVGLSTSEGYFERNAASASDAKEESKNDAGETKNQKRKEARDLKTADEVSAEERDLQPTQVVLSLRGGEAVARLFSSGTVGQSDLLAKSGELEARYRVRFTAELRPTILVGLAEASIGRAAPENTLRGSDAAFRSHIEFFYRGPVFGKNLLTLSYDSQRPLNRTMGRDRMFGFDPLDRIYPVFGDSSTRFDEVSSNSKLYARLDRGRTYAMFGDFEADMTDTALASYGRKLTGAKVHIENSNGDFVTVTGARPDTAFARDVFPASRLGLLRLSHGDVLQGSEQVFLEVRDRRNPEVILSREPLVRSVDYNLDPLSGQLFFMRSISAFDYDLNLVQVVVTYEHQADGMTSGVYTGRASKRFNSIGLRLGASFVEQQQSQFGTYRLEGIDGEKALWNRGALKFEYALSAGDVISGGNLYDTTQQHAGGNAYSLQLVQPIKLYNSELRAEYARADEGFFNPFGGTVAPGSRRMNAVLDIKPRAGRTFHLGYTNERNRTSNVDNQRDTFSFLWQESFGEKLQGFLGFDLRRLTDSHSAHDVSSQLLTIGAQYKPTDKLEVSVKREQNLSDSDPTYPNQTTVAARYKVSERTNVFFTERLASAPIIPISDGAQTGFVGTSSRRETSIGVESRLGKYTNVVSRYQIENGINGTDSFAVLGLQNRLPVDKKIALDFGYEHGFHLAGQGQGFDSGALGATWMPTKDLRASARYELRDQTGGLGQILSLGAAGRTGDGLTTLARVQWARTNFAGRDNDSFLATAAVALRPINSDDHAILFSYTQRSVTQSGFGKQAPVSESSRVLSTDGYWQPLKDTELYGRFALKFGGNSREGLINASSLTYIAQLRLQRRIRRAFDVAGEGRMLVQPSTHTSRTSVGAEVGYWILPDVRLGFGYSFASVTEPAGSLIAAPPRGFYFTISTKLSSLFDLFGTSQQGLAPTDQTQQVQPTDVKHDETKPPADGATKKP
ncbi:MAG: large repetitive protein [Acidobacteriota bacterium]|nr:large repetitive protein [Acidobacteriota bacterium]